MYRDVLEYGEAHRARLISFDDIIDSNHGWTCACTVALIDCITPAVFIRIFNSRRTGNADHYRAEPSSGVMYPAYRW